MNELVNFLGYKYWVETDQKKIGVRDYRVALDSTPEDVFALIPLIWDIDIEYGYE